jgi:hypothetical protein
MLFDGAIFYGDLTPQTPDQTDEANDPVAKQLSRVCHDTLPWLISISLDGNLDHTRVAVWFGDRFLCGGLLLQARYDRSPG